MFKAVATIRTITLLLASIATVQANATDINFTMTGTSPYCGSATATLNYDGSGNTFNSGNIFTAQLSDPSGSFAAPAIIGTLSSTSVTGEITVVFPSGASGTSYRVRIVSSKPSLVGPDNGSNLTIIPAGTPSIVITADPATTVGAGSVISFTSSVTEAGSFPTIVWKNKGNVVGTGRTFVLASATAGDEIFATVTSQAGCAEPPTGISNTIELDVDNNLTKTNHTWQARASQFQSSAFVDRKNASGFSIGSKAYIGCGSSTSNTYRNDFWEYDPVADVWTQKADLGKPAIAAGADGRYNAVGFSVGNKGYIGTGRSAVGVRKDFYEFEPIGNTWQARTEFPGAAREQAFGFGISAPPNTRGYVGGGASTGDFKDFYEFNPSGNSWLPRPDFGGGKRVGGASFVIGKRAFLIGGHSITANSWYDDTWEYNQDGNNWIPRAAIPGGGRTRITAFALAGHGYAGLGYSIGGVDGRFYQYDIAADAWTTRAPYPGPATFTHGVGVAITSSNRAFVYKDGTWIEYSIFTTTPFASKMCATEIIPISYDASGFVFGNGNEFELQISSSPDFSVKTKLATESSSSFSGTINAPIPASADGTYYFRIESSQPRLWTPLETITVTSLSSNHTITTVGSNTVCKGVAVVFNSALEGPGFQWYKNDIAVGDDSPSYVDDALLDGDKIKCIRTYEAGCTAPVGVASKVITMTVRSPGIPIITVNQPNTLTSSAATQYQWYKDGGTIPQATGQSYVMTGSGVYKVRVADSGGCYAFSDELPDAFTGLEDRWFMLEVSAYPSPFSSNMFLSLTDDVLAQGCDFSMVNELGQTIIDRQPATRFNKLDLSGKAPGLYLLRVSFGENTVVRRLVKVD